MVFAADQTGAGRLDVARVSAAILAHGGCCICAMEKVVSMAAGVSARRIRSAGARGEDNERWFYVNGGNVPQWWPGLVAGASCCSWCVVHGAGAAIDERGGRAASGAVKALTA